MKTRKPIGSGKQKTGVPKRARLCDPFDPVRLKTAECKRIPAVFGKRAARGDQKIPIEQDDLDRRGLVCFLLLFHAFVSFRSVVENVPDLRRALGLSERDGAVRGIGDRTVLGSIPFYRTVLPNTLDFFVKS